MEKFILVAMKEYIVLINNKNYPHNLDKRMKLKVNLFLPLSGCIPTKLKKIRYKISSIDGIFALH